MSYIVEEKHKQQLDKYQINIETIYVANNQILKRNTNNSHNDTIIEGVRIKKNYYLKDNLVHMENKFDTRITYTYISSEDETFKCVNCGMVSSIKTFLDGCPYCNTHYNIEYKDADLGSKYHYDLVLKSNLYKIITGIVDFLISLILCYFYIKYTSRTFNEYDISKVFIYGLILSLILYYFFYLLDAYIVLGPIKKYKTKINKKQEEFWKETKIDKKVFFNNLNYEIRNKYYSQKNIIDYDILDYDSYKNYYQDNLLHVTVLLYIRIVYLENGKIKSKYFKDRITLVRHEKGILDIKSGTNMIRCNHCGSSININDGKCKYCDTSIDAYQEWIMKD